MVASKLITFQVPLVLKHVVDGLTPSVSELSAATSTGVVPLTVPLAAVLSYGAIRIGASLCSEMRNVAFSRVSARANSTISQHVFQKLHELSLQYHLSRHTGAISSIIDRGRRGMTWILNQVVFQVVPTVLEIVLVTGYLTQSLGPEFGLVTAATVAVYSAWTIRVTAWRMQVRKDMNAADSSASALVVDSLMNYETVKIFTAERSEAQRYGSRLAQYEDGLRKTATSLALLNFGQQFIFGVGMTAMLLLCAQGVVAQQLTVGDLIMANGFLLQLSFPLSWLGTMYSESRRSLIDLQEMLNILEEKQVQPPARASATPLLLTSSDVNPPSIEFNDVGFQYPAASDDQEPLLRNFSCSVPPGTVLGLVGHSGSGKSTLFRLLLRFFDITHGSISINGRDIRDIELNSLRQSIGVIPQDVVLFNSTLYENVHLGNPDASVAEVEAAIEAAALGSVVAGLPDGLHTRVGERGLKLSGGEKQRVAIARAFLKRSPILLVDEGTASLDSGTEAEVLAGLRAAAAQQGCTMLVIAHRLSTLQAAEQICVLRNGLVVESGPHTDLLRLGGEYSELWAHQQWEP